MEQKFHPFHLWEDYKHCFYDNCSGKVKEEKLKICVDFFNNNELVYEFMERVLKEWKYSCEHNLTNNSMNKIAYLGQASLALYCNVPSTVTMESWSMLSKNVQNQANEIAKQLLIKYNYVE